MLRVPLRALVLVLVAITFACPAAAETVFPKGLQIGLTPTGGLTPNPQLNGFTDPPKGFVLPQGKMYNIYFPGHAISMPPPLADGTVKYQDGTKATLPQEAHDVVTFLTWAAEPYMEDRKQTGAKAILFLLAMTGVLYGAKRKVWKNVH